MGVRRSRPPPEYELPREQAVALDACLGQMAQVLEKRGEALLAPIRGLPDPLNDKGHREGGLESDLVLPSRERAPP